MFAYELLKNSKDMHLPRNWKKLIEITENKFSKKEIEYNLRFKSPIKKFLNKEIGYLNVKRQGKYNMVRVVNVIPQMRGKGCGRMLYEHAIKELGQLSTNYHNASLLAQRLWRRLIKKYKYEVDFFNGVLTVFDKIIDK